nr:hypothetical protein [Fredinandcohnia onubensis]
MDFVEIAILVLIWGIFGVNVVKVYNKAKKEKRNRIFDYKNFEFWEESMRIIGILLFISGLIADIALVKHIGAYLLASGWLLSGILLMKENKNRGALITMVAVLFGVIYYLIWF